MKNIRAASSVEIYFGFFLPVFVKLYHLVGRPLASGSAIGTLEILEFIPEASVDPIYLGTAMLVGPDEEYGGIDGYATFVDALAETGAAAVGVLYGRTRRTRDRRVVIQRYRERGLLLRELFDASELGAIEEVELPRSVRGCLMAGAFELWTRAIERRRLAG